jgi:hypothetical protein
VTANKTDRREYWRAYRAAHREQKHESDRKWYESHREQRLKDMREWYAAHPEKTREYSQSRYKAHPEYWREWSPAYREADPERTKAHSIITHAIRDGKISRQPCIKCGSPNSDAHHPDYSKPFEVIWLCRIHHKRQHKLERAG